VEELVYQLEQTRATIIIAYSSAIETAFAAARIVGLSPSRIIVLPDPSAISTPPNHSTTDELIAEGLANETAFIERKLKPGEAKTKVAFLSFSSGTTGKAKV
jgi:acyl-coenzyme A synthetase/AMP-(fatty) acid ligase